MGRHVGRSRGCRICIKRKIKCDEAVPECYQCTSSGRPCPGPLQGTLFIDMSDVVRQNLGNGKAGEVSLCKPQPQPQGTIENAARAPTSCPQERNKRFCQASEPQMLYQPERRAIVQQLYVAHFIASEDTRVHPWLAELPNILPRPNGNEELYAIRAATMALYGKITRDKQVEAEALKWYSKGLKVQRTQLCLASQKGNYKPCIRGAIGAAILFSYFESIICTIPMGRLQHYAAAAELLEVAGPENCQSGLMHMFFRSTRIASFIKALTFDRESVFASEIWCTVPFATTMKTSFDKLVDLLLQLPSCLPCRNEMRRLRDKDPDKSDRLRRCLETTAQHLHSRLEQFGQEHKAEVDPNYDQRIQTLSFLIPSTESMIQSTTYFVPFENSSDAYFTSMYDSGNLIVLEYLASASPTTELSNMYKRQMAVHCGSVLASAAYQKAQNPSTGGSFSTVFPLKLLCLLSPSEDQRNMGRVALQNWESGRGLRDIFEVASPTYLDRSHG